MSRPISRPMPAGRRACSRRRAGLLALVLALAGCAAPDVARDGSYLFRSGQEYVRLEPIEPQAPPNAHPYRTSPEQLRRLLAGVRVKGAASVGRIPVFTPEELDRIAAPLATALARARPDQDAGFAVAGHRGLFGHVSPRSFTTGRLFATGESLNLIFGLVQARLDRSYIELPPENIRVIPGERARRIGDPAWELDPGRGELRARRGDWVVFEREAPAQPARAAPPASRPPPEPARESRPAPRAEAPLTAEEVERRIGVLDSLRNRGIITDEEYLERRRAILNGI